MLLDGREEEEELVGDSGPDVSVKLIMWKVNGLSLLALDRRLTGLVSGLARVDVGNGVKHMMIMNKDDKQFFDD